MPKYIVRHGVMRNIGIFTSRGGELFSRGHRVIARTHRGMESGEILCEATEHAVAGLQEPKYGQILRRATSDDERDLRKLFEQERREYEVCQQRIEDMGVPMRLVDVEHLYGGERIVVYYLADGRVDFRELVKTLAKEFQTRIEMRQIGVRDEAKLLADYGDCGKPVCCNTHLSEMPPVSMKMAKLQKATLDPTKISGRCGRLKCCLRYEYDTYQDLRRELPPIGAEIITNNGRAKVLAQEILAGQVLVETEEMRRIVIDASDVLTVLKKEKTKRSDRPSGGAPAKQDGQQTTRKRGPSRDESTQKPNASRSPQGASTSESNPAAGSRAKRKKPDSNTDRAAGRKAPESTEASDSSRGTREPSQQPPPEPQTPEQTTSHTETPPESEGGATAQVNPPQDPPEHPLE